MCHSIARQSLSARGDAGCCLKELINTTENVVAELQSLVVGPQRRQARVSVKLLFNGESVFSRHCSPRGQSCEASYGAGALCKIRRSASELLPSKFASAQQAEKAAVSLPQIDWRAKMANKHDERAERDGGKRRHEEVNTCFGGGHAVGCRTIACS